MVNTADIISGLWKWKFIIIIGTLAAAMVSVMISWSLPNIYRSQIVLQPAQAILSEGNKDMYLYATANTYAVYAPQEYFYYGNPVRVFADSSDMIKSMVESGTFNTAVTESIKESGVTEIPDPLKFEVDIVEKTHFLKIMIDTRNVNAGIEALHALFRVLSGRERYADFVAYYKNELESTIDKYRTSLQRMQTAKQSIIEIISETKTRLNELAAEMKPERSMLVSGQEKVSDGKTDQKIESKMPSVQKELNSSDNVNRIKDKIIGLKKDLLYYQFPMVEGRTINLATFEKEINRLTRKIDLLEKDRDKILTIQVVDPPRALNSPVGPNRKRNVGLVTGVAFFAMILLSILLGYLSPYLPILRKA